MQKIGLCAVILGFLYVGTGRAGNIDCVKFLRANDHKICMKTLKETSPSLVAEINGVLYYASTTPDARGGIMVNYNGTDYSLYNRDDEEYELIHWLSGADALVDGVWRDRLADTTDTGPLNFVNNGCVWNGEHTGYYSADGVAQYFKTATIPTLDFGTDWYMEITAQIGAPIGTECPVVDLGSLGGTEIGKNADGLLISNNYNNGKVPGQIGTNTKPYEVGGGSSVTTGAATYTWGDKTIFTLGENRYGINSSRSFITWNGNRYYGAPYRTVQWNKWAYYFFLFRGWAAKWSYDGFESIYQCGPSTIYDIKVWRKK